MQQPARPEEPVRQPPQPPRQAPVPPQQQPAPHAAPQPAGNSRNLRSRPYNRNTSRSLSRRNR